MSVSADEAVVAAFDFDGTLTTRDTLLAFIRFTHGRMVEMLHRHQAEGHTVCVVTASIDEWVRPVCDRLGIRVLLATHIEVSPDGSLTGRFLSPNCYGSEKVERLLEAFPHRATYKLYAYGNGRGDRELLALADEAFLVSGRGCYFLFLYTKICTRRNKG